MYNKDEESWGIMKIRKRVYVIIGIAIAIIGVVIFFVFMNKPVVQFKEDIGKIEIKGEYDPKSFISRVRGHDINDIEVDESQVNIEKIGTYELIYKLNDKEYILKVEVVDTVAPTFEVNSLDIDLGMNVSVEDIVKNINDETETKSYFKETYDFSKEGEQEVIVVVEDAGGNKTEKSANVKIVKDEEKPTLSGLHDINVTKNGKINYLAGVTAKDNRDPQPRIDVNSSQVDTNQVGVYNVVYTVTDRAGNSHSYTKKVTVSQKSVSNHGQSGNKVVYLTFDDGPSENTAQILNILDKYHAKATFFVTGNGQKYNYLIKEAHNKGHTIGLHTYTHNYSKVYASVDAYFNDLNKVGEMVKGLIGFIPKYIRFPGGGSNMVSKKYTPGIMTTLVSEVQNRGYQYYDWNASTGDASGNNIAVHKLVKEATSSHANNIMILAHDTKAKSTTVQALPKIIEHYQGLGYTFKAIDDNSYAPHHKVNN